MAYSILHLSDMLDTLGEGECIKRIANFSCPFDNDIEYFITEKAIMFQRMGISRTYLVYTSYKNENILVGYFSLAPKVLYIRKNVSTTLRKKLTGTKSKLVNEIPVYLIGQLSKKFANGMDKLITGENLLRFAFEKILEAQHLSGGRVILC